MGLQGDVREHLRALEGAGATAVVVKTPEELAGVDAAVLPGGESTTIGKLLERFQLLQPLAERARSGMPLYGTCAGLILMAHEVVGREEAPHRLEVLDVVVRRNAYGRQVDSFEADVDFSSFDSPLHAVFIRAPWVEKFGDRVEVLARVASGRAADRIVAVRQGVLLATSFHPEITGDDRVHRYFVDLVRS